MSYSIDSFMPPHIKFNVVAEEPDEPTYYARNVNGKFVFNFTDKFKRPVKTNFA